MEISTTKFLLCCGTIAAICGTFGVLIGLGTC